MLWIPLSFPSTVSSFLKCYDKKVELEAPFLLKKSDRVSYRMLLFWVKLGGLRALIGHSLYVWSDAIKFKICWSLTFIHTFFIWLTQIKFWSWIFHAGSILQVTIAFHCSCFVNWYSELFLVFTMYMVVSSLFTTFSYIQALKSNSFSTTGKHNTQITNNVMPFYVVCTKRRGKV